MAIFWLLNMSKLSIKMLHLPLIVVNCWFKDWIKKTKTIKVLSRIGQCVVNVIMGVMTLIRFLTWNDKLSKKPS